MKLSNHPATDEGVIHQPPTREEGVTPASHQRGGGNTSIPPEMRALSGNCYVGIVEYSVLNHLQPARLLFYGSNNNRTKR